MKLTTAVARRLLPAQRQSRAKNQSRNPEDTKGRRRRKGQLSQTTVKSTKLTVILGIWTGAGITIACFPSVRFCSFLRFNQITCCHITMLHNTFTLARARLYQWSIWEKIIWSIWEKIISVEAMTEKTGKIWHFIVVIELD